ncbi:MAG TPA: pyridoxal-phosphate dependent enzyme [Thermoplasmataceae archaeon]|nr:pyridoxal-phosphate dependent enzyme [Thermoplasmataceae archaeon]
MQAACMDCGSRRKNLEHRCVECGGLFELLPDFKYMERMESNFPYISEWLSIGEVVTPIVSRGDLSFKLDYFSPTYSYKDRGARSLLSYLITESRKSGFHSINEDSSGNAGAAISAYGSVSGFNVNIFVPERTSHAKIGQIASYGANIVKVPGSREDVQAAAERAEGVYASHVLMPEFRDGIRTLSYEIFKQYSGDIPDHVFVPVSAGTLLLGLYSGFKHLLESNEIKRMPGIVAVQTEQVSPLCSRKSGTDFNPDRKVDSVADALVSMKPPLIVNMMEAVREGSCITVSEEEIISARKDLSGIGMYVEYSSATVYAAYKKKNFEGKSLLVLTGNGLKNVP